MIILILILLVTFLIMLPVSIRTKLVIFFFFMSIEGFLKHLTMYNPIVHGIKYIVPLIIYAYYLLIPQYPKVISAKTPLNNLLKLYLLIVMLQLFNPLNYHGGWGAFLLTFAAFIHYLVYIPLFFIAFSIIKDKKYLYKLILTIIFILGVFNIFALVQMHQGLDFYARLTPSFLSEYKHYGYTGGFTKFEQPRPFSTYTTPYSLAIACMIEIFLCWAIMWRRKNITILLFWPLVLFFSISCAALIFTYVRTVILEVVIGFLAVFLIIRGKFFLKFRNILLILVVILTFLKIVPTFKTAGKEKISTIKQPFSAFKASRGHLSRNALEVFKEYPFGAGLGRSLAANLNFFYKMDYREQKFSVAESNFIVILGDLSFVGLLVTILIFGKIVFLGAGIIAKVKDADLRWIAISLFGLLIGMMFNCPISIAFDSAYFWFLTGVLLSLDKIKDDQITDDAGTDLL